VDREIAASSSAVNVSSAAVAEVLPLSPDKASEGVAVTVVVLGAYAREPKCGVSITLNKGV